jgi:hypothetical protein
MVASLAAAPRGHDGSSPPSPRRDSLNLVSVSSDRPRTTAGQPAPAVAFSFRLNGSAALPSRVHYTWFAAHTVGRSAAWMLARSGKSLDRNPLAGAVVRAPGGVGNLPQSADQIMALLHREEELAPDPAAIALAIVGLRSADAVVAGPFSAEDVLAPGLVPHVAELAGQAYRALRPPPKLIAHPGFGQLARRFQFIQMSHADARWLAAGAVDVGVLAQCLRRLQGGLGEFAITSFRSWGILWAEGRWWEIEPFGGELDESRAGAAFCSAWVVARRFLRASAAHALVYARSAALNSTLRQRPEA